MNPFPLKYKGIDYQSHSDVKCLELHIDSNKFNNEISCISLLSNIVELVAIRRCRYLVFNQLGIDFCLIEELHDFTKNIIFKQIKVLGVEKIIFLIKEEQLLFYKKFETNDSFLIGFTNKAKSFRWMHLKSNKYKNENTLQ